MIYLNNIKSILCAWLSFINEETRKTPNKEKRMDILSPDGPFLKSSYNIGFMQTYSESCVLNKKGCHFPAAPANPSHMPSLPETSRTTSTIFRANFSRLNFDSGAKILGDIIKYDYLGKREGKRERKEEEKKAGAGMHQRGRGRKGAEEKQEEAAEVGRNDEW